MRQEPEHPSHAGPKQTHRTNPRDAPPARLEEEEPSSGLCNTEREVTHKSDRVPPRSSHKLPAPVVLVELLGCAVKIVQPVCVSPVEPMEHRRTD